MKKKIGAAALTGAHSRQENALSNNLSEAELQLVIEAAELGASQSGFDNGPVWENGWGNNNPDSWPYPD